MTLGRTPSKVEGTPALGGAAAHQRVSEHELTQAGQLYPQIKAHYTINELLCFWGLLYPVILHWKLSLPPSFYSLHSFFFFVPSDFGWMINSLNEIAESKEKATTRYPTEQKTSTNMPALIDPIEPALRKGKTWEISDWTSFSLTHTNKHTETMKKRRRYGVIQINSMTFQCVCIYTKSHGWESELQFHI